MAPPHTANRRAKAAVLIRKIAKRFSTTYYALGIARLRQGGRWSDRSSLFGRRRRSYNNASKSPTNPSERFVQHRRVRCAHAVTPHNREEGDDEDEEQVARRGDGPAGGWRPPASALTYLKRHMPELLSLYGDACELAGDDGLSAQIIILVPEPNFQFLNLSGVRAEIIGRRRASHFLRKNAPGTGLEMSTHCPAAQLRTSDIDPRTERAHERPAPQHDYPGLLVNVR